MFCKKGKDLEEEKKLTSEDVKDVNGGAIYGATSDLIEDPTEYIDTDKEEPDGIRIRG